MQLETCIKKGKFILNPIIDWEDIDVWRYIKSNNIEYPNLYDKGYKRLGCIGCPMSHRAALELEQYPKIKALYIRAFDKMIDERKKRGKPTTWKTGQEVYDWWVSNTKKEFVFDGQIEIEREQKKDES